MIHDNNKFRTPIASISSDLEGAPSTVPGSGSAEDKTKMSGIPVTGTVSVPPLVEASLPGSTAYVKTQSKGIDTGLSTPNRNVGDDSNGSKFIGLDEQIALLERAAKEVGYVPESEEDRVKREKKERSKRIISAVSDGLRSLGNLYFTSQYAPDMYSQESSQLKAQNAALERARADREGKKEQYYNYAMAIGKLKEAKEDKGYQRGRDALADRIREAAEKRAQAQANREQAMADLRYEIAQGKLTEQQAKAREQEIKAEYAARMQEANLAVKASQVAKNKAQANKANQPSGSAKSSGGVKSGVHYDNAGKPYAYDRNGDIHYFSDYKTAMQYAQNEDTYDTYDVVKDVTTTDKRGKTSTSQTVQKQGYSKKPTKKSIGW